MIVLSRLIHFKLTTHIPSIFNCIIYNLTSFSKLIINIFSVDSNVLNVETTNNKLKEHRSNGNTLSNEIITLPLQNTGQSCSYAENRARSEDDCIAVILVKELKEKKAQSNNNTSFTITIQNHET